MEYLQDLLRTSEMHEYHPNDSNDVLIRIKQSAQYQYPLYD